MEMMQRPTVLKYKNYRYFKASSALMAIAIAAYAASDPVGDEAYGGTWLGYVLGIVSLLIMFVLMWYGITKRRPPKHLDRRQGQRSDRRRHYDGESQLNADKRSHVDRRKHHARDRWRHGVTLQGWLSAHVYMGTSLVVLATLHAGFQFGWNVHTLSYVLMLLVIASGFYGMYAYLNYPQLITQNMGEDTLDGMLLDIAELDELARVRALNLPDEVNELVTKSRKGTRVGGNLFQMLSGYQRDCPTAVAAQRILQLGEKYTSDDQPKLMRDLYSVLVRKEKLVSRARTEILLKARMEFWLYFHVPLSIALLAALVAHIVAIYFYW